MVVTVSTPIISVIIPTYNGDRYLTQAIESVLEQTHQDYELLVVDDGSTDTTPNLVQANPTWEQLRQTQTLRYIRQANQGVSAARNHGIQLARGAIIAFLDADDWFLPTKLEQQSEVFFQEPDVGMVHSGWRRVSAEGNPLMDVTPWHDCPHLDLEQWLQWKPVLPSAMMFRKEWLFRADGFDSHFPLAEDTDLVLRLAAMGCQTAWLKDITVCYRQHDASAIQQGLKQARSLSTVIDQLFSRTDLPPHVQRNETATRFSTWVWIAWDLYRTGHPMEMADYLKQSWCHSTLSPVDTIVTWVESFAQFSKNIGTTLDTNTLCQDPAWVDAVQWCLSQGP